MNRDWAAALALIVLLLLIGLGVGRAFRPEVVQPIGDSAAAAFRGWFWEHQTFDLLAQICLIFAGALGVAAVLPPQETSKTDESPVVREDMY